jgi:hypothetical protein
MWAEVDVFMGSTARWWSFFWEIYICKVVKSSEGKLEGE